MGITGSANEDTAETTLLKIFSIPVFSVVPGAALSPTRNENSSLKLARTRPSPGSGFDSYAVGFATSDQLLRTRA